MYEKLFVPDIYIGLLKSGHISEALTGLKLNIFVNKSQIQQYHLYVFLQFHSLTYPFESYKTQRDGICCRLCLSCKVNFGKKP